MRRVWGLVFGLALCAVTTAANGDTEKWLKDLTSYKLPRSAAAYEALLAQGPSMFGRVLPLLQSTEQLATRLLAAKLLLAYSADMKSVQQFANQLSAALEDEDAAVVAVVIDVCRKVESPGVFAKRLASDNPRVREAAAIVLGRMGQPAAAVLDELLDDRSVPLRAAALRAFAESEQLAKPRLARFVAAYKDPNAEVRASALRAWKVASGNPAEIVPLLLGALDDSGLAVREVASELLLGYRALAWSGLLERMRAGTTNDAVELTVARLDAGVLPDLVAALAAEPTPVRIALLRALGRSKTLVLNADGLAAFKACFTHDDRQLAAVAALQIDSIRGVPAALREPLLLAAMRDADASLRNSALRTASMRPGNRNNFETAFRAGLKHADPGTRAWCWVGLRNLGVADRPTLEFAAAGLREGSAETAAALETIGIAALPVRSDLRKAVLGKDETAALAALRVALEIRRRLAPGTPSDRRARFAKQLLATRKSCRRAWQWLAKAQSPPLSLRSGLWNCGKFGGYREGDIGVTSLALLAFAAGGIGVDDPEFGHVVRRGLDALIAGEKRERGKSAGTQMEVGVLCKTSSPQFLVQHGMATAALAESILLGAPRSIYENPTKRALNYVLYAHNPWLAWRYEPRGGENDTFVTVWMVHAMTMASYAGLRTDRNAVDGALKWFSKMAGKYDGRVGYNISGGSPARMKKRGSLETFSVWGPRAPDPFEADASESMTAAALWATLLLAPEQRKKLEERFRAQEALLAARLPEWDPEDHRVDLFYWYFASRALALRAYGGSRKAAKKWKSELPKLLLPHQEPDGSWSPVGVWGSQGGRVYSTAMSVMTLLGMDHLGPSVVKRARPQLVRSVDSIISKAKKSSHRSVRETAAKAR